MLCDRETNNRFQIEQFIETLFPRQDPKKLAQEARAKQTQEPTMSAGETAIMVGVVLAVLLTMTGLMVSHTSPAGAMSAR